MKEKAHLRCGEKRIENIKASPCLLTARSLPVLLFSFCFLIFSFACKNQMVIDILPKEGDIKTDPEVKWPSGLQAYTGQLLSNVSITGGSSTPAGKFTWTTPSNPVGAAGTQTHNMTFTPDDTVNYSILTQDVNINVTTITVAFNSNGGTSVASFTGLVFGAAITAPTAPAKNGAYLCIFDGWYKEAALTNQWVFASDKVTANITLYAKWKAYNLGDTGPGGGKIYYRRETGFTVQMANSAQNYTAYYLEAAPANMSGRPIWASEDILIPGLSQNYTTDNTDWGIGRGRMNTAIIIAHGAANGYTTPAASLCASHTAGGKSDWFLPSLEELYALYTYWNDNSRPADFNLVEVYYSNHHSSSQRDFAVTWVVNFNNGSQGGGNKKGEYYPVRAVRAF